MDYVTMLLAILYTFIFVFGIIGNMAIIVFFGFNMKRDTSFRWFIIQLSIADCICCAVSPFFWFYLLATEGRWHLGTFVCKAFTPVGSLTVTVSAWTLCGIAFERYRAIVHPLEHRLSKKAINVFGFIVWTVAFVTSLPYFVFTNVDSTENICQPVFTPNQQLITGLVTLVIQTIIPVFMMAAFFIIIQSALRKKIKIAALLKPDLKNGCTELASKTKSTNKNKSIEPEIGETTEKIPKTKRRSTKSREKDALETLRVAVIVFVLCSLPFNVFHVLAVYMFRFNRYTLEQMQKYTSVYTQLNLWLSLLVLLNSVMNCFIYAGKFPAFRKFLVSLFRRNRGGFQERSSNRTEGYGHESESMMSPIIGRRNQNGS